MQHNTSFSLGISPLPDNPDFDKFNKTFKETIDKFASLKIVYKIPYRRAPRLAECVARAKVSCIQA